MQIIKCQKTISKSKDIDLGVATITGRYPESVFSMKTYYCDTNYCIVASCSTPAWDINQYKILQ